MNEMNKFAVIYRILNTNRITKKQIANVYKVPPDEISRHVSKFNKRQSKYLIKYDNDGYYCNTPFNNCDIELISSDFVNSTYISKIVFLLFKQVSNRKVVDSYFDFITTKVLDTKLKNINFNKLSLLKKYEYSKLKYVISQLSVVQIIPDSLDMNYMFINPTIWQIDDSVLFEKYKIIAQYFTKLIFEDIGIENVGSASYYAMYFYIFQEVIGNECVDSTSPKISKFTMFGYAIKYPFFLEINTVKTLLFFDSELISKEIDVNKVKNLEQVKKLCEERIRFYETENLLSVEDYYYHSGSKTIKYTLFAVAEYLEKEIDFKLLPKETFFRICNPIMNIWLQNLSHNPSYMESKVDIKHEEYAFIGCSPLFNLHTKVSNTENLRIAEINNSFYVEYAKGQDRLELNKILLFFNLKICSYRKESVIVTFGNAPSGYHVLKFVLKRNYPNIEFLFISDIYYLENRDKFQGVLVRAQAMCLKLKLMTCRSIDNNYPALLD